MVWVGVEVGELCVASLTPRQKLRNVRRDPRVAITFESPEHDVAASAAPAGCASISASGTARITEGGAPALLRKLGAVYLGRTWKFPPSDDPPEGWIMRITPESPARLRPLEPARRGRARTPAGRAG